MTLVILVDLCYTLYGVTIVTIVYVFCEVHDEICRSGKYGPAHEERGEEGSRRPPSATIPVPKAGLRTGLCGNAAFVLMPVRACN